jgi:hypothetical protein
MLERDKIDKEKTIEVQQLEAVMQRDMETQLDATTKRTIEENSRMHTELRYQSQCSEFLLQENQKLRHGSSLMARELTIITDLNSTMTKRLSFFERVFLKMQEKEKGQEHATTKSVQEGAVNARVLPSIRPGRFSSTQQELRLDKPESKTLLGPQDSTGSTLPGSNGEQGSSILLEAPENFGSDLNSASKALDSFILLRSEQSQDASAALKLNSFMQGQRLPQPPPKPPKRVRKDRYKASNYAKQKMLLFDPAPMQVCASNRWRGCWG